MSFGGCNEFEAGVVAAVQPAKARPAAACRNEEGNIENAILRMPEFGSSQEILCVEGNFSDGTFEECERVRDACRHQAFEAGRQGQGRRRRLAFHEFDQISQLLLAAGLWW